MNSPEMDRANQIHRRQLLGAAFAAAAAPALSSLSIAADSPAALKGRIKQSLVQWCYVNYGEKWKFEQLCAIARQLGCVSVELCAVENWPELKKHGLTCAISGSHNRDHGMNNPRNWDTCLETLHKRIDQCAEFGCPNVITFCGLAEEISYEAGTKNCVEGFKKVIGYAEKKKVTLCLEMLNSRVNIAMKGHPGHQGDHIDYCVDICKRVGSERMKVLFDVYHVQIMDGDIISRIRQHKDFIGHVHTAGVPGRGELDTKQEVFYPAVMEALLEVGYSGYVGHEFIPTRDALAGLKQAVSLCDV